MKFNLFVILFCVAIMFSCSSKDEPFKEPEINPGEIKLDLVNSEMIRLWNGTACDFAAVEDEEYTIESKDSNVATASVKGKTFTVKTHLPGETDLIIKDQKGNETVLKCYSRAFSEDWEEHVNLDYFYKNSINIAVWDKTIKEQIESEIKESWLHNRAYYVYDFKENSDQLLVYTTSQTEPIEGTYIWDIEARKLTINYGGKTEIYSCDIMPQYPNLFENYPRFIMAISMDLTEKYREKYPDADIVEVNVIRHMISRKDYWCIKRKQDE